MPLTQSPLQRNGEAGGRPRGLDEGPLTGWWRLRLLGCNAPEVHGPSKPAGLAAKQYTIDHLMGKPIVVRSVKTDDFGRWLAAVTVDGRDYTAQMIADGQAVPFMVPKVG